MYFLFRGRRGRLVQGQFFFCFFEQVFHERETTEEGREKNRRRTKKEKKEESLDGIVKLCTVLVLLRGEKPVRDRKREIMQIVFMSCLEADGFGWNSSSFSVWVRRKMGEE